MTNNPKNTNSLEVSLVFDVRKCRACPFFWPTNQPQPYGPYPAYDFQVNYPPLSGETHPPGDHSQIAWVKGFTRTENFPNPEVIDGCRKAPIMTIGINPNLTAFAANPMGARWMYPNFTSDNKTNEWAKYAYYYRYRTVMQESMGKDLLYNSLLPDGQVVAAKPGYITYPERSGIETKITFTIKYDDGTSEDQTLSWNPGEPGYVVLVYDDEQFAAGTVIAARLDVKADQLIQVYQEEVGYYEQYVPVINMFSDYLKELGHTDANLKMGEDVCQMDMVACASPHWNPDYLGGEDSENAIIANCVNTNAWALKQMVQTKPAVLTLVGESSYNMFNDAFGKYIDPPVPGDPEDGAFTLLRETTDPNTPHYFDFSGTIGGKTYSFKTRLVVSPHFSYDSNFYIQARFSQNDWQAFKENCADAYNYLDENEDVQIEDPEYDDGFYAVEFVKNAGQTLGMLKQNYPDGWAEIEPRLYDPHFMLAEALEQEYQKGNLAYVDGTGDKPGYPARTAGDCDFCVNANWIFPDGCPYGKVPE